MSRTPIFAIQHGYFVAQHHVFCHQQIGQALSARLCRVTRLDFHNAALVAIAQTARQSLAQLQGINGLGVGKLDAYGAAVLEVIGALVVGQFHT